MIRRIFLFVLVNILVVTALSAVLSFFHVQPFLQGYGLDIPSLALFCLVWGMGGALISLALSRQMAKWMMNVKVINPQHASPEGLKLLEIVHRLARQANLAHMPQVGIFASDTPNAFATGPSQRRSLVAVSSGLLNRMSQEEIEGVVGHELSHIANGDMVTLTLIQGVANAFVMFLARILAYAVSGLGKRNRDRSSVGSYAMYRICTIAFELLFMVLASGVICWFSRKREFRADRGGAMLAGKEQMISALTALQRFQEVSTKNPLLEDDKKATAFQSMQISSQKRGKWLRWFMTHPPLEERIARLSNSL